MLFTKMTDISLSSSNAGAEQAHGTTSPPFHLLPQPVAGQACSPPSRRATAPVNHIPGPGMQKELVPHKRKHLLLLQTKHQPGAARPPAELPTPGRVRGNVPALTRGLPCTRLSGALSENNIKPRKISAPAHRQQRSANSWGFAGRGTTSQAASPRKARKSMFLRKHSAPSPCVGN